MRGLHGGLDGAAPLQDPRCSKTRMMKYESENMRPTMRRRGRREKDVLAEGEEEGWGGGNQEAKCQQEGWQEDGDPVSSHSTQGTGPSFAGGQIQGRIQRQRRRVSASPVLSSCTLAVGCGCVTAQVRTDMRVSTEHCGPAVVARHEMARASSRS